MNRSGVGPSSPTVKRRRTMADPAVLGLVLALGPTTACYDGAGGGDSAGQDAGTDGATDSASGGESAGETEGEPEPPPEAGGIGIMGMRRLSRAELDKTLEDLLGDTSRPAQTHLPEDPVDPFDNDWSQQFASTVLVEGLEALANQVSTSLLADPQRLDQVVGCEPDGATDEVCMQSFIETFGRRVLRRPVRDEELTDWTQLGMSYAQQSGDFYEGVDVVLRMFLQHPNFVYRIEIGTPTTEPGVFRLDDWEVASRLSYFLWGSTPNDELLDLAADQRLGTPEDVGEAAAWMLDDPRARDRIDRFHSMWLGYYTLPHAPEITTAMRQETRMLLEDVIFDDPRSYLEVFQANGTYVNDTLAELYGLPAPGTDELVWVDYGDSGRQGLLSHGSFLSVAAKFGDTSPTQRGLLIRRRLLCQVVPPPPPDVDVDNPPQSAESECKIDRYEEHRQNGACQGCHELVDPVGFGLEQYDQLGRVRTFEAEAPQCEISGDGAIDGASFNGPAELADHLIDNELLDTCLVSQVYRFAMGHEVGDEDMRYVDDLQTLFRTDGYRFDQLMLSLVTDEAFLYRREEE